jgi:hypothetical protein
MHRTSILLDEEAQEAARDLARRYRCSVSEAIRRAILRHRDTLLGVSAEVRAERVRALARMVELFDGHDAEAEVARIKREDDGF